MADQTLQDSLALGNDRRKQQCPMCRRLRPVREFKLAHVHPILPPEMYCARCRQEYGLIDYEDTASSLRPIEKKFQPSKNPAPLTCKLKLGTEVYHFPDKKKLRKWLRNHDLSIKQADQNTRFNVVFYINPHHRSDVNLWPHHWVFDEDRGQNVCKKCGILSTIDIAIEAGHYDPELGLWEDDWQDYYIRGTSRCHKEY